MKRKKLLYVGNALSNSGKTVTHIETLSRVLQAEGYEVTITSSKPNKAIRLIDMVRTFLRCRKEIDIVLIDTYSTANFWYAVTIARLCRSYNIPYVPILHGGNLPARLQSNRRGSKKLFEGALINVAPSEYLKNAFAKAGFSNLKHIPNSIEISDYFYKKRGIFAPKLLWVRSFAKIYNPLMAVQVLESLIENYPAAVLTMVGPEKDSSLGTCSAYVESKDLPVTFTGKLSKEEWVLLSQDFDIFINTTDFDNTPVSIIEAMALGLPIVSTNVGGLPFLINDGDDGLLSPPKDVHLFTSKVSELLENQELAKSISKKARVKAQSMDWLEVKALWHEVLS